ncbi:translation initiation factor IF-2 N-terminal domain-containing protein [Corynebacterium sp.]|uniref:translation initiation factor IF-2 N-terminal domain-containing protein n=1 Tax=Corynebacterium sp. TaxID=1720 RepID=UPI0026DF1D8C|nr:translation initiation factor IF-2 N-terminal domain-containing protein [Corynebacterium sp.]MDO5512890.1 translation initiation factor IF-2 N-terminal domain-containing protein [Corynebacterium sp.]
MRRTTTEAAPKVRVHALAKELGTTSKEIIEVLAGMDLKKVAQSTLSVEEVDKVRAALAPEEPDEDRIRTRVRKNVANEISQIEEKVESDLAELLKEQPEEELLEDVTPEITPKPEDPPALVPLFMAPGTEEAEEEEEEPAASRRRRRGRRGASRGRGVDEVEDGGVDKQEPEESDDDLPEEPVALKGSTRLESQRRRRAELREEGRRKKHIVSQAEFLARRESVARTMVVRERQRHDHPGMVTQVGVLEDDLLVEHFVTSEAQASMIGNIYLGRVQNVLPSMEAAFIDIGKGRNGVLYAGEVDWKSAGLGGRSRKIEQALKSGDQVLVQVSKDPVGHKGARLTTQISLAGRYLVYVPGGRSAGISRKLPGPERKRLKEILSKVVPGQGGAIIRTAAENVSEEAIAADVDRLHRLWEDIQNRADSEINSRGSKPVTMYEEPDMLVKVVRDLFNEDFTSLVVDGDRAWNTVHAYVKSVAPDLLDRLQKYQRSAHEGLDAFAQFRVDEQLQKALNRKVWLPSGGSLVIDRTEAMTVVDVNTGKFTGSGGNLEETVTRNNLEAAEEIVRQMRLRDLGGMIVVDFIDMVLPENQELVLRRLKEALGRDRTRHQVSEVTSLGLVQMTRKRLGTGLLETFSTECEHCAGRGLILHDDPVEEPVEIPEKSRKKPQEHPAARAMQREESAEEESGADSDIEELAASVVVTESEDAEDAGDSGDASRRRRSRRGRRGTSRGRETVSEISEIEDIVSAALDHAGEEDPDEPTGADYVPEKSFQQAVADFDASPRRRRRTRGNSRSDHRPQSEDFSGSESSGPAEEKTAEQEEGGRRRRRRATRSRAPEKQEQQEQQTEKTAEKPAEEPRSNRPSEVSSGAPSATRSRGRRRAVRRTTTAAEPSKPVTAAEKQAPVEDGGVEKRGRGRRRATRRTSSR